MKYVNSEIKYYNNDYTIYCHSYETQYNWGHIVKIYHIDKIYPISTNKIVYYNRTWETYRYQSCILGAIDNLIESRKQELYDDFKEKNNIKRLTKDKKSDIIANDTLLEEYKNMYEYFKRR